MAYENLNGRFLPGLVAAADYSANDWHFPATVHASNGTAVLSASAGELCGFVTNKPASGKAADFALEGNIVRAKSAGAITRFTKVSSNGANGTVKTAVTGNHIIGIALETASGANEIIAVLVTLGGAPLP